MSLMQLHFIVMSSQCCHINMSFNNKTAEEDKVVIKTHFTSRNCVNTSYFLPLVEI